jgi:hypothetical protein
MPARRASPINDDPTLTFIEIHFDLAQFCVEHCDWDHALNHYTLIQERVTKDDMLLPGGKAKILAVIATEINRTLAHKAGCELTTKLSDEKQAAMARLICKAEPAQLAKFRRLMDERAAIGSALEVLSLPGS